MLDVDGSNGHAFVFRKINKLEFGKARERYPDSTFGSPPWNSVYPTTAQGNGLAYRIQPDDEWKGGDARVLKLMLQSTQKVDQVGTAETIVADWFHLEDEYPWRRFGVMVGDWVLYRNHLKAVSMSEAELATMQAPPWTVDADEDDRVPPPCLASLSREVHKTRSTSARWGEGSWWRVHAS